MVLPKSSNLEMHEGAITSSPTWKTLVFFILSRKWSSSWVESDVLCFHLYFCDNQ